MDEFLRSHPLVAWIGAGLAFVVFVILLLHMVKILLELRRRIPSGERSRQLRLGFVENFDLDGERQLLLVRRDNVEHLLLIGGPNDVLVESGIVRAEARAPRGGFESGQVAPSAPSPLVLAPAHETKPEPLAPEPPPRSDVARFEPKPAPQLSPKPQDKAEPHPEPKLEGLPEIDLEEELKAALEATPLTPSEPEPAPVEPPPPPPSRFAPPPRPTFRAPLPPRMPQGGAAGFPGAPTAPGAEQRPRFVIPPLARRNPPPPPPAVEPPPPVAAPEPPQSPVEPPAPELFAPPQQPEPNKPEQEAPQAPPPPRPDPETLESLEEEMAKLLGRPPRP
ncbi:hypothetical protein GJ654_15850 [Rhodoblastus acidophilus]|uniref:Flagellar biosynthesis protein, FliO n=1 Tax=Rhodoblastus acidophilus TaxID=1074 RepID=A0A6N8DPR3_RHOAC|nr:hypothetical protein [Rhodoblastus acidophilus]MCW2275895.1 hypothetical protein [Rhodoblastus acidophilus]MTV32459.1 hypothetical protein [Rhodoblastus acidophilus]